MSADPTPLRVAMVGCGGRANVHAPQAAECPLVDIVRWLDVDRDKAAQMADRFGGRVAASWDEILDDQGIEGVVIALPHDLHHGYGMAAARAGKQIMLEIPVASTLAEANELIAAAAEAGVTLLVLHSLRFWQSHRAVAELVRAGELGEPHFARYHNEHYVPDAYFGRQPGQFAAEAGVLHHGDLMRWWVGEVEAVTACALTFEQSSKDRQTFDHITVLYDFTTGALGESTTSWITRSRADLRTVRASVSLTDGMIVMDTGGEVRVYSHGGRLENGAHSETRRFDPPDQPWGEIAHFAEIVRLGAEPYVTPADSLRALELTLAARNSAREGTRMVLRKPGATGPDRD